MVLTVKQTDYLNIGLILLAFGAAIYLPFELFLFSYAVLGPLHYLTEINWLDDRGYFLAQKRDVRWLIGLTGLIFLPSIFFQLFQTDLFGSLKIFLPKMWADRTSKILQQLFSGLVGLTFAVSLVLALIRERPKKYVWLAGFTGFVFLLQIWMPAYFGFFTLMLPSIIHVSVFTALFMLAGTLRQGIFSGYLALLVYALCIALLLLPVIDFGHYQASQYAQQSFGSSGFRRINQALYWFWGAGPDLPLFTSTLALRVQALVAFVYTYHYLNWFAKTGVIGWHKMPKGQLWLTLALWLGCVGLYAYSYALGLAVLALLSFLHVVLEFPLNHKIILQIFASLSEKIGLSPSK